MSIEHKGIGHCSCPMCTGQSNVDEEAAAQVRQPQMAPVYNDSQVIGQINSGASWSGNQITYGFLQSSPAWDIGWEGDGFSAFSAYQVNSTQVIMSLWDDLISPSFVQVNSNQEFADVNFGNTNTSISYAHAYYPGSSLWAGEVWLNASTYTGLYTPDPGDYYWMTILHEVGHAIGLSHPGNYNGGSPTYANNAVYAQDTHQWSVMSYFSASNTGADWNGGSGWQYAQTPMVHDILTIQAIYGADQTTRTGDTVYGFNSNAGQSVFDFSQNQSPVLTIYDAGGTDTLDLSGFSMRAVINLEPGTYSSAGGTSSTMTYNIGIAGNTWVENAIGGSGSDTIYGNALANQLSGGAGNDHLYGLGGNNTLTGGSGTDWAYLSLDLSSYTFQVQQNYIQVVSSATDIVYNDIEWLTFNDTTMSYADLETLWGLSTVESNGDYELLSTPMQYSISDGNGNDVDLTRDGAGVGPNSYADWSAVQAEECGNGGYLVLWKSTGGSYCLWEVDASGARQTVYTVDPEDYETIFDVDLDQDGQIEQGSGLGTTLEANGDYSLVTYSGQYFVRDSNSNDVGLTISGTPVGPDFYPDWNAVQAEEDGNGGFHVLWQSTGGSYCLWQVSSGGVRQSVSSVDPVDYEIAFDVDINQDGTVGPGGGGGGGGNGGQGTTLESNGDYDLVTYSGQYFVRDSNNNDVGLTLGGAAVGPDTYPDWDAVQVEEDGNGGFHVLWQSTGGSYCLWQVSSGGVRQSVSSVDPVDYEIAFDVDINQDGTVGPGGGGGGQGTTLESNGDYDLVTYSNQYFVRDSNNNDVGLTIGGSSVGPASYDGWSAVQAEECDNGGFLVLWKSSGGSYCIWEVSAAGERLSVYSVDPENYEVTFDVDLDQDGQIEQGNGIGITIEMNGDYDLVYYSSQYFIRDNGNNDVGLTLSGTAVGPDTYPDWNAIQTEEDGSGGYLVLWQSTGGSYCVWAVNAAGARQGVYSVNPSDYEITYDADLDQDGQVGALSLIIQSSAADSDGWLYGTAGDNVFVFADDSEDYTISGFETNDSIAMDMIDVSDFGFDAYDDGTLNDLESTMSQNGDDVVLTLGSGSITLSNINIASLNEDDFIL